MGFNDLKVVEVHSFIWFYYGMATDQKRLLKSDTQKLMNNSTWKYLDTFKKDSFNCHSELVSFNGMAG